MFPGSIFLWLSRARIDRTSDINAGNIRTAIIKKNLKYVKNRHVPF